MIYKLLFWGLISLLAIYFIVKKGNVIAQILEFIWQVFIIYVYCRPMYKYQIWYIKRHGWTPYWYKSKRIEDNGKLYEHPDLWIHKDYKSTRYNNEDGAYPMWSAWMISRGKKEI